MNLNTILKKAWQILWHYRALWLFGTVMAVVGVTAIFPGPWMDWENNDQWTTIKVSDIITIQVPGSDMTIDFTAPGGVHINTPNTTSWREFRNLVEEIDREASIHLWPILIELAMILVVLLLLGVVARYVTETAVIRMVNETEETGKRLGLWEGLRRGFSIGAWRLFLLDLVIGMIGTVAFIIVFGLAIAPSLLAIGRHEVVLITAGVGTVGLLIVAFYLWIASNAVLSLVLQPIRRLCVLEDQGLPSSIRQGILLTIHHLKEIGPLWLVWIGIKLFWIPLAVPIVILLAPILLLTTLLGMVLGGVSATLLAAIIDLFISGATPWIMGALAGLPIFIFVLVSPILLVSGWVEIYKSCLWTLAYRDMRAMEKEKLVQATASHTRGLPVQSTVN